MKQCSKCKQWKNVDEFGKRKRSKDRLQAWCKKCLNKNNNEYYYSNKDEILDKSKIYYSNNKKQKSESGKKYYKNNKDNLRNTRQKWYKRNKDDIELNLSSPLPYDSKLKIRKELELYEEVKKSSFDNVMVKCTYCGEWFEPTKRQIQSRVLAINGNITEGTENRLYCSSQCKQNCPIYRKIKYTEYQKPATSREVQPELRQMVFERDNYTCQKCNTHRDNLEVGIHCHHKEGILWEPLQSADMDMCITLCEDCHDKVHQIPGCEYQDLKCA